MSDITDLAAAVIVDLEHLSVEERMRRIHELATACLAITTLDRWHRPLLELEALKNLSAPQISPSPPVKPVCAICGLLPAGDRDPLSPYCGVCDPDGQKLYYDIYSGRRPRKDRVLR